MKRPDTSVEALLPEVRRRLAERLEIELSEVSEDCHVLDDLEAESMDLLVLVSELEDEYAIAIADEALPGLSTPRQIAQHLSELLAR